MDNHYRTATIIRRKGLHIHPFSVIATCGPGGLITRVDCRRATFVTVNGMKRIRIENRSGTWFLYADEITGYADERDI